MNSSQPNFNLLERGRIVYFLWRNEPRWPVSFVSGNVGEVLGYQASEFIETKFYYADLIHPDDIINVQETLIAASNNEASEFSQKGYRLRHKNGSFRHVYDHTRIVRNEQNEISHYEGYIYDESEIYFQRERLQLVLEGTGLGMWDWNPKTNNITFDKRWAQMLGYHLEELPPTLDSWKSRIHPDDLDNTFKDVQDHINGKTEFYTNIHRLQHKNGKWLYILDRGKIVEHDLEGNPIRFTGTHTDITELKESEIALKAINSELEAKNRIIEELAHRDSLTNLFNRRAFDARLKEEWARKLRSGTEFSLIMIDIDYFKPYNDSLGHLKGDDCLIQVAKCLEETITRSTDFLCRYGGEEFILILPSTDLIDANRLAQNIRSNIEDLAIPHPSTELDNGVVTCSMGVSYSGSLIGTNSSIELLESVDKALYQAKDIGRNCVALAKQTP